MTNQTYDPATVFLVSGQLAEQKIGGRGGLTPEVTQRVVIADDAAAAYRALAEQEPAFAPLGHASLADYERAAAQLRDAMAGTKTDWPLYRA